MFCGMILSTPLLGTLIQTLLFSVHVATVDRGGFILGWGGQLPPNLSLAPKYLGYSSSTQC